MTEAKTYYGPWLNMLPKDAPDGSIWEWKRPFYADVIAVVVGGHIRSAMSSSGDYVTKGDRCRRVYPPGSVLPEPRPLVVNGKVRDLSESKWWMIGGTQGGKLKWSLSACDESWVYSFKQGVPAQLLVEDLCYPVQPLNGAFVPIPWPDSGCTTE